MSVHLFKFSLLLALGSVICIGSEVAAQQQKGSTEKAQTTEQEQVQDQSKPKQEEDSGDRKTALLDIEMTDICGKKVNLKKYEGKVVLIVNVASKCGFTGQYRPLQALHNEYNQKGLEVVAFPCNQFGKQEPADEKAISAFCKKKFGIKFDMFSKVHVKGDKQAELFRRLTRCELQPAGKGDVRWNFEKFLIGKDGKPVARFRSNVAPDSEAFVFQLKKALGITDEKEKPARTEDSGNEKSSTPAKQKAKEAGNKKAAVKEDKKP
jgi:glutathione peroxidase